MRIICRLIRRGSSSTTGRFASRENADENCKWQNFRADDSRNVACTAILSSAQVHRRATMCIRTYQTASSSERGSRSFVSPRHPPIRFFILRHFLLANFRKDGRRGFRILNTPSVFPGKSTSASLRRLHIYPSYYHTTVTSIRFNYHPRKNKRLPKLPVHWQSLFSLSFL